MEVESDKEKRILGSALTVKNDFHWEETLSSVLTTEKYLLNPLV